MKIGDTVTIDGAEYKIRRAGSGELYLGLIEVSKPTGIICTRCGSARCLRYDGGSGMIDTHTPDTTYHCMLNLSGGPDWKIFRGTVKE